MKPGAERPYRVWGYPYTALAFILFSGALLASTLWSSPWEAAKGLVVVAAGVPAFWYWRGRGSSRPA